ncbi:uncharacterized protein LOC103524119 [Diaphorina citri]|uniref:Uncharacterized protein LOC103524119 n=1 Tax=Diaphorina citri TaxID=121845 RepID=A0A1S3DTS9_DIACI|nr:uncharacterized protein LOC103524119 [Diaphorina citri]
MPRRRNAFGDTTPNLRAGASPKSLDNIVNVIISHVIVTTECCVLDLNTVGACVASAIVKTAGLVQRVTVAPLMTPVYLLREERCARARESVNAVCANVLKIAREDIPAGSARNARPVLEDVRSLRIVFSAKYTRQDHCPRRSVLRIVR